MCPYHFTLFSFLAFLTVHSYLVILCTQGVCSMRKGKLIFCWLVKPNSEPGILDARKKLVE